MSSLRPLERDDLEQVAALFLRAARPGSADPPDDIAAYFERTTLDHPWADPEIPPLVFADDGGVITGFVGSYVTKMRLEGQAIRAACPGNLVAAPDARGAPPGALLLREYLNGPQDLTFVDTLGPSSRPMWTALGGDTAFLGGLSWNRVLRPFGLASERLLERQRPRAARLAPAASRALDAAVLSLGPRLLRPELPRTRVQTLEPGLVMSELPRLTAGLRLHPDYDAAYLEWLFGELGRPRRRGSLVRRVVRDDGDRVLGWYVYYLKPGGISRVLQIMGSDGIGAVIDHLFHDAEAGGATALEGRVEARLLQPLAARRCVLRYTGAAGFTSESAEIREAIQSRHSAFTRMDSEYWPIPPRRDPRDSSP